MKNKRDYNEVINNLSNKMGVGKSFDVVRRDIKIAGKDSSIFFIDGFIKDDVMVWILSILQSCKKEEVLPNFLKNIISLKIPYVECNSTDDMEELEYCILSGSAVLFIEGVEEGIVIDTRTYPARGPEEPDLEKVTRGSRDGFVETIIFNTALIRRRIRDPNLRFELMKVGKRSQNDVAIGYIGDIVNSQMLDDLREKINKIDTESLLMGVKTLEEYIFGNSWNPFPQARFTERPDVAAAHMLEGHIIILVDTTPSVMILPVTIFHFTQHAEDYYQNPTIGSYIRWVRHISIFLSYILSPLWLLLVQNREFLPVWLEFIGPEKTGEISLLLQFIILEVGIDVLRIASIHTPNALTTSLGIIGALLLGEFAVKVGLFIPETILYTAIVGIGMFATPSIEFAMAVRIFRLILIVFTGLFNIYGFIAGIILLLISLFKTKSFGGVDYLWPLIPFNKRALKSILLRTPIPEVRMRPEFLKTENDETRSRDENNKR
ncbi:stage V sporulation protein AF [Gottschalkia purinilytica]|uniref:Stage V sporulation protein AF n=1 Tax=Gottschalkia purinilytica TaxID=1503 RepID=A0A0L0WCR3_GOTPU|nr:spore germination protein [Gottschalkia purinilytica]KNF09257.1 stage V sporulation protein AF [Gottschalkia purinilytica]